MIRFRSLRKRPHSSFLFLLILGTPPPPSNGTSGDFVIRSVYLQGLGAKNAHSFACERRSRRGQGNDITLPLFVRLRPPGIEKAPASSRKQGLRVSIKTISNNYFVKIDFFYHVIDTMKQGCMCIDKCLFSLINVNRNGGFKRN